MKIKKKSGDFHIKKIIIIHKWREGEKKRRKNK